MREIGDLQREHQFELVGQWVPRELNELADALSRQMTLKDALDVAYPVGG